MEQKGARRPHVAMRAANAALRVCLASARSKGTPTKDTTTTCEAKAIRIGLAVSNRGAQHHGKQT